MHRQFTGYAVFDVETTGLSHSGHDRVIEIGIVRLDEALNFIESWETLINPGRDIGDSKIHGIYARDLLDAPRFSDIAADIWHRFEGAIPVAHNLPFDSRFLAAEYLRAGHNVPQLVGHCTLRLCQELRVGSRRLSEACRELGIPVGQCHSAGADAKMCAQLFMQYASEHTLTGDFDPLSCDTLWRKPATSVGKSRSLAHSTRAATPFASLINFSAQVPVSNDLLEHGSSRLYLELLDRVLEDRILTDHEAAELKDFAHSCGFNDTQLAALHFEYVKWLAQSVSPQLPISDHHRRDIEQVADLLGVSRTAVFDTPAMPIATTPNGEDLHGLRVCFTGAACCRIDGVPIERPQAEQLAARHGLVPVNSVTRKTDLLVVSDAHTMSSKADKARKYGIRIMTQSVLWRKLGIPAT